MADHSLSFFKKAAFTLIMLMMVTVTCAFTGEILLRLVNRKELKKYDAESNPFFLSDQDKKILWTAGNTGLDRHKLLGWIGKPHEPRIMWQFTEFKAKIAANAEGFFDDEFEINKNKKRIMVLGDSMTFPTGVRINETYPNVLQGMFDNKVDVMNMGITSYGTAQEYLVYKLYGKKYKPDVVILAFQILNDITDNRRDGTPLLGMVDENFELIRAPIEKVESNAAGKVDNGGSSVPVKIKMFLSGKSLLYNHLKILKKSSIILSVLRQLGIAETKYCDEFKVVFSSTLPAQFQKDWDLTQQIILELKKSVEKDGGKFVFLLLGVREQTDTRAWKQFQNQYYKDVVDTDRFGINKTIVNFLNHNKIAYIDTTDAFVKAAEVEGKILHFPMDRHMNVDGHQLTAQLIYDYLSEKGLLNLKKS